MQVLCCCELLGILLSQNCFFFLELQLASLRSAGAWSPSVLMSRVSVCTLIHLEFANLPEMES